MIKAVADTNVYISALNFRGVAEEVLAPARKGEVMLFISAPILKEIEGVLTDKFAWSEKDAQRAIAGIKKFTDIVYPKEKLNAVKNDAADNRIIECAQAAQTHFIISGDRHLKALKTFQGIRIISPAEFLRLIKG